MATSLTSLKPLNLNITDSYTFGNANVTANVAAGNVKTDNLLHANGVAWTFGGTPGGSNSFIQFNNSSNFGGSANLTFDSATNLLNLTGNLTVSGKTNLGNVGNITITGGSANYILKTDGTGNLSWTQQTGGSGGSAASITVDNFTANGSQTQFTLSTTPSSANNLTVNIDGVVQLHSSYTLSGNVVTLTGTPVNGAVIDVTTISGISGNIASYNTRTATGDGSTTAYTVTSGMTVDTTLVTLDGVVQTPTTDYTISGTTITFTTAPYNGAAIQLRELGTTVVSPGTLTIADEGSNLTTAATSINFVGTNVTATNTGNAVTVTVSGTSNTSIRAQAMTMGIIFGG